MTTEPRQAPEWGTSERAQHYAEMTASGDTAVLRAAIRDLCHDNERLAVRLQSFSKVERDIHAERQRQMTHEGWTPEHDDTHAGGQMALAAGCYAMFASASDSQRANTDMPGSLASLGKTITGWAAWLQIWPWDRKWWKPTDRRRDLVKAGALIIAEIERLDRLESRKAQATGNHSPHTFEGERHG